METDIIIHVETSDTDSEEKLQDLLDALEKLVPYIFDNVVITSEPHQERN